MKTGSALPLELKEYVVLFHLWVIHLERLQNKLTLVLLLHRSMDKAQKSVFFFFLKLASDFLARFGKYSYVHIRMF